MASVIPKEVRKEQPDKWAAEVLYVALFQNSSNCTTDGISLYGDCTNECASIGNYTTGGKLLTSTSVYSSLDALFRATDLPWTNLTLMYAARYAVIYVKTGATIGKIRGVFDFGSDIALATSGVLTIHWNTLGLIKVS